MQKITISKLLAKFAKQAEGMDKVGGFIYPEDVRALKKLITKERKRYFQRGYRRGYNTAVERSYTFTNMK